MLDQGSDVVRHERDAQGSIDVGRAPVALQVHSDHLSAPSKGGEIRPEHLERAQAAVQQDERPAGAGDLVIQLYAVHVGVVAHTLGVATPRALGRTLGGRLGAQGHRRDDLDQGDYCRNATHCHVSL